MPRTAEATTGRHASSPEASMPHYAGRRRQATTRRAIRQSVVLLLGFSLSACGPVYLHDPAGEAAATAARTQFQEALSEGASLRPYRHLSCPEYRAGRRNPRAAKGRRPERNLYDVGQAMAGSARSNAG